ncbi:hypothetical protein GR11A_00116 [Vibrio phage vB_VcorM_GR11A]|nr:hypothetical protein GR11A_00116 [Vibrio phage vB_VcorM_GR11A]
MAFRPKDEGLTDKEPSGAYTQRLVDKVKSAKEFEPIRVLNSLGERALDSLPTILVGKRLHDQLTGVLNSIDMSASLLNTNQLIDDLNKQLEAARKQGNKDLESSIQTKLDSAQRVAEFQDSADRELIDKIFNKEKIDKAQAEAILEATQAITDDITRLSDVKSVGVTDVLATGSRTARDERLGAKHRTGVARELVSALAMDQRIAGTEAFQELSMTLESGDKLDEKQFKMVADGLDELREVMEKNNRIANQSSSWLESLSKADSSKERLEIINNIQTELENNGHFEKELADIQASFSDDGKMNAHTSRKVSTILEKMTQDTTDTKILYSLNELNDNFDTSILNNEELADAMSKNSLGERFLENPEIVSTGQSLLSGGLAMAFQAMGLGNLDAMLGLSDMGAGVLTAGAGGLLGSMASKLPKKGVLGKLTSLVPGVGDRETPREAYQDGYGDGQRRRAAEERNRGRRAMADIDYRDARRKPKKRGRMSRVAHSLKGRAGRVLGGIMGIGGLAADFFTPSEPSSDRYIDDRVDLGTKREEAIRRNRRQTIEDTMGRRPRPAPRRSSRLGRFARSAAGRAGAGIAGLGALASTAFDMFSPAEPDVRGRGRMDPEYYQDLSRERATSRNDYGREQARKVMEPDYRKSSKMGGKLGGISKMLGTAGRFGTKALKFLGPLGVLASTGLDAFSGWDDAAAISGKREQDLTTGDKLQSSIANIASGLTFGLLDADTAYSGLDFFTNNPMFGTEDKKPEISAALDDTGLGRTKDKPLTVEESEKSQEKSTSFMSKTLDAMMMASPLGLVSSMLPDVLKSREENDMSMSRLIDNSLNNVSDISKNVTEMTTDVSSGLGKVMLGVGSALGLTNITDSIGDAASSAWDWLMGDDDSTALASTEPVKPQSVRSVNAIPERSAVDIKDDTAQLNKKVNMAATTASVTSSEKNVKATEKAGDTNNVTVVQGGSGNSGGGLVRSRPQVDDYGISAMNANLYGT